MIKKSVHTIKGMNKDLSPSLHSNEYAFENKNIRIQTTEEGSLLRITNEKGTKEFGEFGEDPYDPDMYFNLKGKILGSAQCKQGLVIFTNADMVYYISNLEITNKKTSCNIDIIWDGTVKGVLFNNKTSSIQTLVIETEKEARIYFIQENTPPRVLKVYSDIVDYSQIYKKPTDFDFIPELVNTHLTYKISKFYNGSSTFSSGVIQYAFSYIDINGRESKLFLVSPLYYISNQDRGSSPEENILNTFSIELEKIDYSFEYIRIYSIQRTSLDATPICRIVDDVQIKKPYRTEEDIYYLNSDNIEIIDVYENNSISLTDWIKDGTDEGKIYIGYPYEIKNNENHTYMSLPGFGITIDTINKIIYTRGCIITPNFYYVDTNKGSVIDPSLLFYIGGEEFYAGAITQKNNTLFLGNIVLPEKQNYDKSILGDFIFDTTTKSIKYVDKPDYYYSYDLKLDRNSSEIKVFKGGETYKLGIQLQDKKGNWSNPIEITEWKNNNYPQFSYDRYYTKDYKVDFTLPRITIKSNDINNLYQQGIRKIRPVVIYPDDYNREVLFQGVVNPTVYNIEDRYTNAPFAQASWFFRPFTPYKIKSEFSEDDQKSFYPKYNSKVNPINRRSLVSTGSNVEDDSTESTTALNKDGTENTRLKKLFYPQGYNFNIQNVGDVAEFRHNYPIPNNLERNAEIQNIRTAKKPYTYTIDDVESFISDYRGNYNIDQNIVTLNSPDIEFNDNYNNLNLSEYKFRLVGIIPFTSNYSDLDINTETPPLYICDLSSTTYVEEAYPAKGFIKKTPSTTGNSNEYNYHYGYRTMLTSVSWYDEIWRAVYSKHEMSQYPDGDDLIGFASYVKVWRGLYNSGSYTTGRDQHTGFVVYPWHRDGSLNNQKFGEANGYKSSKLKQKRMSNFRFSYGSLYINSTDYYSIYNPSDIQIFNLKEVQAIKLKTPTGSKVPFWYYYGNVDKVSVASKSYPIAIANRGKLSDDIFTNTSKYGVLSNAWSEGTLYYATGDTVYGGYMTLLYASTMANNMNGGTDYRNTKNTYGYGSDPVHIKYSSSPHAVISLGNIIAEASTYKEYYQWVIPNINEDVHMGGEPYWNTDIQGYEYQDEIIPWLKTIKGPSPYALDYSFKLQFGYLFIGEIYREVTNKFQNSEFETWLPCGETVEVIEGSNSTIIWEEGDTFYQRYDCIKTYPTTKEDQNSMTEVLSFMCETRINLDLRYDKYRQNISYINTNVENVNKINSVYQQKNNFFTYKTYDLNIYNKNLNFPTTVIWSLPKEKGSIIDTWTSITTGASLELNNECGRLTSLLNNNDSIIAFQEKGISNILYNEQTQISTTNGVPIEISNSGKVTGSRYITTQLGAQKSASICPSLTGIYFVDYYNKGIYFLNNNNVTNLTETLGFNSWAKNIKIPKFNNNSIDDVVYNIFYDKTNSEMLFTNYKEAFGYSETLKSFTSFYDYEKVSLLGNINEIKNNKLYPIIFQYRHGNNFTHPVLYQEGDYNYFFKEFKPFYVTIIENKEPLEDKIFNTVEFRADTWDNYGFLSNAIPFNKLTVWNEYQEGVSELQFKTGISNLKKKFRIWRANIPRDNKSPLKRDRIRNPWAYIKLEAFENTINKVILNDIVVYYT